MDLKESYIKAVWEGLSIPLKSISFEINENEIIFTNDSLTTNTDYLFVMKMLYSLKKLDLEFSLNLLRFY